MIDKFVAFITNQQLFSPHDHILLAVSGGVDSMVLAHLFRQAGYAFGMAHCNFRLRGQESDEDEAFVREAARQYGVECLVASFNTIDESKKRGESVQMAARELRYQWFEQLLQQYDYQYVATAHHKNDVLETMLFNLCKGTGIAGLRGIPQKNGPFVRPLLFADRQAVEAYAKQEQLLWREDSSNASVRYARNLLRLEVIPRLLQINPSLLQTLQDTMSRLQETESIQQHYVAQIKEACWQQRGSEQYLSIQVLRQAVALPLVLSELLRPYGFHYGQAQAIARHLQAQDPPQAGTYFESAAYMLNIDREHLILSAVRHAPEEEHQLSLTDTSLQVDALFRLHCSMLDAARYTVSTEAGVAALDRDKLVFPLKIRPWQAGDWFYPLGMKGKKKLSDFMIDRKIPLNLKAKIYVLLSGEAIVWVIGHRIDDRYKITPATRHVLQITQEVL